MIYLKWKAKGFKVKLKMGVDNAQSQQSTLQKRGSPGQPKPTEVFQLITSN